MNQLTGLVSATGDEEIEHYGPEQGKNEDCEPLSQVAHENIPRHRQVSTTLLLPAEAQSPTSMAILTLKFWHTLSLQQAHSSTLYCPESYIACYPQKLTTSPGSY